jgi:hypothetical protein
VRTSRLGCVQAAIPLRAARLEGDRLDVPYGKDTIRDAPHIRRRGPIHGSVEAALNRYYGLPRGTSGPSSSLPFRNEDGGSPPSPSA